MNSKLPHTWKESKLDLLIDFYIGGDWGEESQVSSDYIAVRVIRATDFSNWEKTNGQNAQIRYLKTSSIEKRELKDNDLVLEISGGSPDQPVGRSVIIKLDKLDEQKYTCSNFFRLLRINDNEILPAYLNYYFKFLYETRIIEQYQSNSTNLRNLKFKQFLMQNVPYPKNILEQQEIVQVLDTMSDIIRLREECISHAQDLIPALFQEMFKQYINQKDKHISIGSVTSDTKQINPSKIFDTDFYYIDIASINNDTGIIETPKIININDAPSRARKLVQTNDVIISMTRPYLKGFSIVPERLDGQIASTGFAVLRSIPEKLSPLYLFAYVRTDMFVEQLIPKMKGANYPAVRDSDVRSVKIPFPPIELQEQFAEKVREINSYIEEQQEELENAKQMFQSLLHHAFTGELTRKKYGGGN